jgi:class 3 adenylate cyclase
MAVREATRAPSARGDVLMLVVLLPVALVALLRGVPAIDDRWENNPIHFWLVLLTALVALGLALAIVEGAKRRRDARLLLIGLAFAVSAGFLGLHALATPGQIVAYKNAGFVIATPIGLVAAGAFAAASAVEYRVETSLRIVRNARLFELALLLVFAAWATVSAANLRPLRDSVTPDQLRWPLGLVGAVGVIAYAFAALSYFRVYRRRESFLVLVVTFAFALLAEALVVAVVSLPTSWRLSWWEWHALMLVAFAAIAGAALREWHEERFSVLYLEETLHGRREISVLFADLAGFTSFSERHRPEEVHAMMLAYFRELAPMIQDEFEGDVDNFVGDQIFAVFNKSGNQPDHAVRAARAALELQRRSGGVAADHPDWPRFRVGVNTGDALVGVVGDRGRRIHGVFGDTVNLGARLEGQAPVGGVVVGGTTFEQLPDGTEVEPLVGLQLKGKALPTTAYVLRSLPG